MRDKGQIFIFSDSELSLIKAVFAENEELLYAIRKVLLQFTLTKDEKKLVKNAVNSEVYSILKKRIFPSVDNDFPFGQLSDLYQTLTNDLKIKTVDEMKMFLDAKQLEIDYLTQQFGYLKNVEATFKPKIVLDDLMVIKGKTTYQACVDTTARNYLLGFIDPMLLLIKSIAGQKVESIEDTKKRMSRDSAK